jgi:hypothetical protein
VYAALENSDDDVGVGKLLWRISKLQPKRVQITRGFYRHRTEMGFSDYHKIKRLKSSKNNKPFRFIMAVTLYVSVSSDHHQVCLYKTNILHVSLNYMIKIAPFFQRHRLKAVCMFWDEYT